MGKKSQTFIIPPTRPKVSGRLVLPEKRSEPITQQRIIFSIECCSDKCCFSRIREQRERADFAARLHELSQLTWGDIGQTSRRGLGYETLDNIRVNRSNLPPGARIIGFVYHLNHRMIGYRDREGIFHIHWFDYNGKLYKH